MRGRKPKPTALKVVAGNPGRHPLNKREPKPRPRRRLPPCPDWLDKAARREWRRMGRQLHDARILTAIDEKALAMLCATWSQYVQAQQALQEYGPVIMSPDKKWPMISPYLAVASKTSSSA